MPRTTPDIPLMEILDETPLPDDVVDIKLSVKREVKEAMSRLKLARESRGKIFHYQEYVMTPALKGVPR